MSGLLWNQAGDPQTALSRWTASPTGSPAFPLGGREKAFLGKAELGTVSGHWGKDHTVSPSSHPYTPKMGHTQTLRQSNTDPQTSITSPQQWVPSPP